MKKYIVLFVALLTIFPGCSSLNLEPRTVPGEKPDVSDVSEVPPPVTFVPPEVDHFTLSNGIAVYFLRDDELPVVRGSLYLKGGALWESRYPNGSFAALGSLMRSGGAGQRSADELDQALEKLSANVSTGFSGEHGTVSFVCLAQDLDTLFSLYSDVLFRPRFQEDRLSLWKGQMKESIRRRKDSPDSIAAVAFNQLIFGDSPLGRPLLTSDLGGISRNLLSELHQTFIRPDGAILAVSGAVSREDLQAILEKYLESWSARGEILSTPEIVTMPPAPGIYFINMPFTQSTIFAGHLGPKRLDPEYTQLEGFNTLFGSEGQFSSLLTKSVRSDLGLAYSVAGGVFQGSPIGKNMIALQTKSESTGEALNASLATLKQIQEGRFQQSDVDDVKRSINNSFVFKFDTTDALVQRRALLSLLKYPETYDDTYTERINSLTPAAISEIARTRWNLDSLVVLVLGNSDALESLQKGIEAGPEYLKTLPFNELRFDESIVK